LRLFTSFPKESWKKREKSILAIFLEDEPRRARVLTDLTYKSTTQHLYNSTNIVVLLKCRIA
jgi:hypothetical protein